MKPLLNWAAPLALLACPVAVQAQHSGTMDDQEAAMAAMAESFQTMFVAEPLTHEQEARLPMASEVVAKVMPEGSYARMLEDTMAQVMQPMFAMMGSTMPAELIAQRLGLAADEIAALDSDKRAAISQLIDPHFGQRNEAAFAYMLDEMTAIMVQLEPGMRGGLAKAYAVRFTAQQLQDIAAFFATDTGAFYATESMLVFTDPQVMQGSMQAMPLVIEHMPQIMAGMEEIFAGSPAAPAAPALADLAAEDRQALAAIIGISEGELQAGMDDAAERENR